MLSLLGRKNLPTKRFWTNWTGADGSNGWRIPPLSQNTCNLTCTFEKSSSHAIEFPKRTLMIATDDSTTYNQPPNFKTSWTNKIPIYITLWMLKIQRRPYNSFLKITNVEGKINLISCYRKNAIQSLSETSFWTWSQITQGYLHWFPSHSIRHLSGVLAFTEHEEEVEFLIRCFTENEYNNELKKITKMYHQKMTSIPNNVNKQEDNTLNSTWIPGLSLKLLKSFWKAG